MHISEGVLSTEVLAGGALLAAAGVGIGLRRLEYERVPQVAVVSAAFFVASLIHVPVGGSNAHLVLNGLAGLLLGWSVFPAFLIALFLQALFFGFGGLEVLGVNTLNMALPGVVCYYAFGRLVRSRNEAALYAAGSAASLAALTLSGVMVAACLYLSNKGFLGVIAAIAAAHVPVFVVEAIVSGFIVVFLHKVKPELLAGAIAAPAAKEIP